jgi:hypothetical protein
MIATNLERWGVMLPVHSEKLRPEMMARSMEKYGSPWWVTSDSVRKKRECTNLERYGVPSFTSTGIPAQAVKNPDVQVRRMKTLARNGNLMRSNVELECLDLLRKIFTKVDSSVYVNGWSIDMHIIDIDTYVQFDGNFWHGLDKSLNEMLESDKPIYNEIARKMIRDKEQIIWFGTNSKKLVRIKESEFNGASDKLLFLKGLFST